MSPFSKPVIIDNNCISILYLAKSLEFILSVWPFRVFIVSSRVLTEAGNWPEHGQQVCNILNGLFERGLINIVSINEDSEEELDAYARLKLIGLLGEGESESIAIAKNRGYIVATDDGIATEECNKVFPKLEIVTTNDVFKMAKNDGLLTQIQINEMWRLIKVREK